MLYGSGLPEKNNLVRRTHPTIHLLMKTLSKRYYGLDGVRVRLARYSIYSLHGIRASFEIPLRTKWEIHEIYQLDHWILKKPNLLALLSKPKPKPQTFRRRKEETQTWDETTKSIRRLRRADDKVEKRRINSPPPLFTLQASETTNVSKTMHWTWL